MQVYIGARAYSAGNPSEREALTRIAALQCGVGRHRHGGGCGVGGGDGQKRGRAEEESRERGVRRWWHRRRQWRLSGSWVSGNVRCRDIRQPPPSHPTAPYLPHPATLFSLRPFRAAHEPHPRDRTRPPNYGLEFELAVNPFIALPPPPARQPPRPAHHHSGPPSAPRPATP